MMPDWMALGPLRSAEGALPRELRDFLHLPGPQTLLVRGPPGSGKSTLALGLASTFPGARLFVSSRVSRSKLLLQYPWVGGLLGHGLEVIDSTSHPGSIQHALQALTASRSVVSPSREEEGEMAGFLWLPPALQEAWSRLDPKVPTVVVVDSWDALIQQYLNPVSRDEGSPVPDRSDLERMLLNLMTRGRVHLVIVQETDQQGPLDYLVDGIVTTYREDFEGRLERWLQLPKLRGVPVLDDRHPFTLAGARFEAIGPYPPAYRFQRLAWSPDPEPKAEGLWPGSRAFVEAFGRLPTGAITVVETDPTVPSSATNLLLGPVLAHVVSQDGNALVFPSIALPDTIYQLGRQAFSHEVLARHLRILTASPPLRPTPELDAVLVPLEAATGVNPLTPRYPGNLQFIHQAISEGHPALGIVSTLSLRELNQVTPRPYLPESFPVILQTYLKVGTTHMIVVGPRGDPFLPAVAGSATTVIRMADRHGRVFLYGEIPRTRGQVLRPNDRDEGNGEPYDLTPVL